MAQVFLTGLEHVVKRPSSWLCKPGRLNSCARKGRLNVRTVYVIVIRTAGLPAKCPKDVEAKFYFDFYFYIKSKCQYDRSGCQRHIDID